MVGETCFPRTSSMSSSEQNLELRARNLPCPARGGAVGATYQPEQASSVRPRPRRAGQERPPRCAADRRVCRDHADTSCAAGLERLAEIVTMRRQLCDEHVAAENQAAHLEDAMLRRLSKRRQTRLEADIRLLDKRLAEMVAANGALAQRYELLTSMPGVGPVLAVTLIALL